MIYKSGERESQIDFLMCRRQQHLLNEVKNCKVINGESVAAHRVLVVDWEIKCSKRRIPEQVTRVPKIKWWRPKIIKKRT